MTQGTSNGYDEAEGCLKVANVCVYVGGGCRKVKSGMQDGQMQQGDGGVEESLVFSALSIFLAFP